MNVEGSVQNMDDIWRVKVDKDDTFMDLGHKANIAIVMSSHHHSAQFMAFKYKADPKTNYEKIPKSEKVEDLIKAKMQINQSAPPVNKCYFNNKIGAKIDPCNGTTPLAKTISINVDPTKPKYMWTFVIGNSGRRIDPIWDDRFMPASLLWARNEFGGANFVFKTNGDVDVTFFATVGVVDEKTKKVEQKQKQTTTLIVKIIKVESAKVNDVYKEIDEKSINTKPYTKLRNKKLKK